MCNPWDSSARHGSLQQAPLDFADLLVSAADRSHRATKSGTPDRRPPSARRLALPPPRALPCHPESAIAGAARSGRGCAQGSEMRSWPFRRRTRAAGSLVLSLDHARATRMGLKPPSAADLSASSQEWLALAARQAPSPARSRRRTHRGTAELSIPTRPSKRSPAALPGARNSHSTTLLERYGASASAKHHPQCNSSAACFLPFTNCSYSFSISCAGSSQSSRAATFLQPALSCACSPGSHNTRARACARAEASCATTNPATSASKGAIPHLSVTITGVPAATASPAVFPKFSFCEGNIKTSALLYAFHFSSPYTASRICTREEIPNSPAIRSSFSFMPPSSGPANTRRSSASRSTLQSDANACSRTSGLFFSDNRPR